MSKFSRRLRERKYSVSDKNFPRFFNSFPNFLAPSQPLVLFAVLVSAALTVIFSLWLVSSLFSFIVYIVSAFIVAVSFEPVVLFLTKYTSRLKATFLVFSSLLTAGVFSSLVFSAIVFNEFSQLVANIPATVTTISERLESLAPSFFSTTRALEDFSLADVSFAAFPTAFGFLSGAVNVTIAVVIIFVFAWYFSAYNPAIRSFIVNLFPSKHKHAADHAYSAAIYSSGRFLFSKIILAFISSVSHVAAFFVIDVPYWFVMGIFAGVTSQFVPVFGTYLGIIVPSFFALKYDPVIVVWIIVFATLYQQVENYILTPKIAGKVMKLNSGLALAATIAGFALLGPLGALLGMPVLAIVLAMYSFFKSSTKTLE